LRTHRRSEGLDGERRQASQTQFKSHATTDRCFY
jgi:hypothetical protein